jgi:hypothetical protein
LLLLYEKVAAGDLLFWKNLKRASGNFPEKNPAYRCDLDTTHASAPVRPRDAAADASAATATAAVAAAAAGAEGATAAAPRNGTATGRPRVGGWVGKLAWQRWFALAEMPFAAERRPWTSSALHRRPFQPVLNCDPVRQRERELGVGEIEIQPVGVTRVMVQQEIGSCVSRSLCTLSLSIAYAHTRRQHAHVQLSALIYAK